MKAKKLIKSIDWQLLADQKKTLLNLQLPNADDQNNIDGLINLLNNIQDYAVDVLGIPESTVFPYMEDV